MLWLLRAAAYAISAFSIWQFVQGGSLDTFAFHRQLAVDQTHGMIFGVCAGISNFTGIDVTLIRFLWALTAFYKGLGIAFYVLAFVLMPVS